MKSAGPLSVLLSEPFRGAAEQKALEPLCYFPLVVNRRAIFLPEYVLCAAASRLQSSTGGYVSLEDYADSVVGVLAALEHYGLISFLSDLETQNSNRSGNRSHIQNTLADPSAARRLHGETKTQKHLSPLPVHSDQ